MEKAVHASSMHDQCITLSDLKNKSKIQHNYPLTAIIKYTYNL